MLSNEAVYGFLGCTRRVSDLAPPRRFTSPIAVAPPFLCIISSSAPLVFPAEPISDPAVFASLLSVRAPSFWSLTNCTWTFQVPVGHHIDEETGTLA